MRAIAKILRARTSEHSYKFASKSSKDQILRALENFKGPYDTPTVMSFISLFLYAFLMCLEQVISFFPQVY